MAGQEKRAALTGKPVYKDRFSQDYILANVLGGLHMPRISVAIAGFFLLISVPAFTQNVPNFSGIWKMDADRSESAHQAVPIGPVTLAIAQSGTQISIDTRTGPKDRATIANERLVYKINGSESKSMGGGHSKVPILCKARWDGSDLVAETARNINGSTITTHWILKLDATGKEMTIEKKLTVQHGYQFPGANNVGTATDVYVKSKAGVAKASLPKQ